MSKEEELEELKNLQAEYESAGIEVYKLLDTLLRSAEIPKPTDIEAFKRASMREKKAIDKLNEYWVITPSE